MVLLRYSSGKKKIHSVNLDEGIVKKTKTILKEFNENLSSLINAELDQWCQDQEAFKIQEKAINELKKEGSFISEKEINKLLNISNTKKILRELKTKKERGTIKKKS